MATMCTSRVHRQRCGALEPTPECFKCQSEWMLARCSWSGPRNGFSELKRSSTKHSRRKPRTKQRWPKGNAGWHFCKPRLRSPASCNFHGDAVAATDRCLVRERDALRVQSRQGWQVDRQWTPFYRKHPIHAHRPSGFEGLAQ